jgi:hypothetical protein
VAWFFRARGTELYKALAAFPIYPFSSHLVACWIGFIKRGELGFTGGARGAGGSGRALG